MDLHIGEMNSTVRAADNEAMLTPRVLDQIVRAVIERLREHETRETRLAAERQLRRDILDDDVDTWRGRP
jgi:hypothetical protein